MPGLAASELPPQTLHPGDTIEYYCRAFVCADSKGFRRAIVTRIDAGENVELPIAVDTDDVIPPDMMMKRVADRFGNMFKPPAAFWRKLRTYKLISGSFVAPPRATTLRILLEGAVKAAVEAVYQALREQRDEYVPGSPHSSARSSLEPETLYEDFQGSSAPPPASTPPTSSAAPCTPAEEAKASEQKGKRSSISELTDLISSEEEGGVAPGADTVPVSDKMIGEAAAYIRAIPTRHARAKIRNQPKKRRAEWHVPRSRKKRDLAKCAITRSGSAIYHAKTLKAIRFKELLKLPEVKGRLKSLHARRTSYPDPALKEQRVLLQEVPWPSEIEPIETCKQNGVKFKDIGEFDRCNCRGDCFLGTCTNAASASFCTPIFCGLGAKCSNAPRTLSTLKLFDTGRVGLGVYTTTHLDIGDILGEYSGELSEFSAFVEGQPDQAVKQNSGYTLLYNAKSTKRKYVYVDALKCGSITRFISHACDPNAAFVVQQTRSRVKVLVKMIKDVKAGAEITVHYGKERWFTCACDDCWENPSEAPSDEY